MGGFALIVALCYLLKKSDLSGNIVNSSTANWRGFVTAETGCCSHCL
jgi:hypothetical protein